MRTTIRLPDALYDDVRRAASTEGATVTSIIERALRAELEGRRTSPASDYVIEPYRPDVGGTRPGVDLDDSAALLDVMDASR